MLRDRNGRFKREDQRPISHLVIPDCQCKPDENLDHLYWAGAYAAEHKPTAIINLGDMWDMPSLSSYEKRGSRYFEGKRYDKDIDAGNRGLYLFDQGLSGYVPERKVLLRGNHEFRIERASNEDPKLEGLIGYHDFNDNEFGWEVIPFLQPICIDSLWYCHYFQNPNTGQPYSGDIATMLKNIGFSFVAGHKQGLQMARRELCNGTIHTGLQAGSFYQHNEEYRGPQALSEWRGVLMLHEVRDGNYDLSSISLDYLRRRYG